MNVIGINIVRHVRVIQIWILSIINIGLIIIQCVKITGIYAKPLLNIKINHLHTLSCGLSQSIMLSN